MAYWDNRLWMTLAGSSLASGVQLVASSDALAHGGSHENDTQSAPPSEDAAEQLPAQADMDTEVTNSEASIQGVPATQATTSATTSRASVSEGFSLGIGESLLGLLIVGPFLLVSLKKRFQS